MKDPILGKWRNLEHGRAAWVIEVVDEERVKVRQERPNGRRYNIFIVNRKRFLAKHEAVND